MLGGRKERQIVLRRGSAFILLGTLTATLALGAEPRLLTPGAISTETRTEAETAFGWLQSLAGEWEGKFKWTGDLSGGGELRMDYFPTGLGSAMIENHRSGSRASMSSVYHMDGSRLVVTHFCLQNQPRLVATEIDLEHRRIRFDFVDVTDLAPTEGHVNGVEMQLADDSEIMLQFHYIHDGKRSIEPIELSRVVSPAIGP